MPEITLAAEVGRPVGSRSARRLRAAGQVPGVVYGHGMDPLSVSVVGRDLRTALSGEAGTNTLLSLQAGEETYLTLARDLQRHPVKGTVLHVDFQIVRRDEVIAAEVPVTLIGEAVEVHRGDGMVDQQLFTVTVQALPAAIPAALELDISELTIGAALRISDLQLPADVTIDLDPEAVVVTGQAARVQEVEAEAEEGAEGAEGQEAAGAESSDTAAEEG